MTLSETARLLPYHLRLAAIGLRRNRTMTLLMYVSLTLGAGVWSVAVTQYTRFNGFGERLSPTLHHVELVRRSELSDALESQRLGRLRVAPLGIELRSLASPDEARLLVTDEVPARHAVSMRAEVVLEADLPGGRGAPAVRMARFANADFFTLFAREFAAGGPWTAAEDEGRGVEAGAGVVVLGKATGEALFPTGGAVGQTVLVDGRPHRVIGVLARHQPLNAPWQLLMNGGLQDALFLPVGELDRSGARPYQPIAVAPARPGRAETLSSQLFVSHWVDLPDAGQRAAYARYLNRVFGPGRAVLRALPEWRRSFALPVSPIGFFNFIGAVVLLGGAFSLGRWLLTRGLVRAPELGVFRALGAPRSALLWRVLSEAALISVPAALTAPLVAAPMVWFFNQRVRVVDIPLETTVWSVTCSIVAPLLFNLAGALYPAGRLAHTPPTLYLGDGT
jgi:putative ABC transport system permease protein